MSSSLYGAGKEPDAGSNSAKARSKLSQPRDNLIKKITPRYAAALGVYDVMQGKSLNQVLPALEQQVDIQEKPFLRDLLLGSCRWYFRLNAIAKILLKSPFDEQEQVLHALLIIGLYQLAIQRKAPHAAVHATVDICEEMGKVYAKPVVNACLRRYGREYEALVAPLDDNPVTQTSHPKWLVKMLTKAWPEAWQNILDANNHIPPVCLRVNSRQVSRDKYMSLLAQANIACHAGRFSEDAIYLSESLDVTSLPHFDEGAVSVQDEAAQLAAELLAPKNGEKVLDACTAPGGKACHLLEKADIELVAMDIDEQRLERVQENLSRIGLSAQLHCADMANLEPDWNPEAFDAILLDVPCSATGVIRRHPDIRMLRRREDIAALQNLQADILEQAWKLLKPGGRLLYATCSVLPIENDIQITHFVNMHTDAQIVTLEGEWGVACEYGRQLFPVKDGHDGFYYALMRKIG